MECVFECKASSFIPTIYIIPVFEYLVEKTQNINDLNLNNFMTYFSNGYMGLKTLIGIIIKNLK